MHFRKVILDYVSPFLQATKAFREIRGIALLCFRPRHQKGRGVSVSLGRDLLPRKTRYPLFRRLGGP
jgi:hypothetical protein